MPPWLGSPGLKSSWRCRRGESSRGVGGGPGSEAPWPVRGPPKDSRDIIILYFIYIVSVYNFEAIFKLAPRARAATTEGQRWYVPRAPSGGGAKMSLILFLSQSERAPRYNNLFSGSDQQFVNE